MTDPNHPGGAPGPGQPGTPGHPTHASEPKVRFSIGQIVGAILLVLLIIFIAENSDHVHIQIIAGPQVSAPLWLVILISAVIGALIAELLRYRRRVTARRKAQLREHRAEHR